jgi:hypothetical protein
MKFDIDGASISRLEQQRVRNALETLAKDPHAPRELKVSVTLSVFNEYPKHVVVGEKDGKPVTEIARDAAHEEELLAKADPVATA